MNIQKDETVIKKFDIVAWYNKAWWAVGTITFSVSHPVILSFSNKRVQYSSGIENLNYSYENIAGIEVLKTALHVKRSRIMPLLIIYFVIGMVGTMVPGFKWLSPYFLALLLLTVLWSIIGRKYVYRISLVSQNAGILCSFFIDRDDILVKDIQNTFENGKQGIVKSNFNQSLNTVQLPQPKSLEDLKHAKELLDIGAISQEEFDEIKNQALGNKNKPAIVQRDEPIVTSSKTVTDYPGSKPNTLKPVETKAPSNKKLIYLSVALVGIVLSVIVFNFLSKKTEENQFAFSKEETPASVPNEPVTDQQESLAPYRDFDKTFSGTINNKYKIEVNLSNENSTLRGSYFYIGKNSKLILSGQIQADGAFVIEELAQGELTGKFVGRLTGNTGTGTWMNKSNTSSLPFEFSEKFSDKDAFLTTSEGLRYKKLKVMIPNHDEGGTTATMEVIGPVEGMYISKNEGNSRSIQINYDGDKIYVLHWNDSENAKREDAYITSKGYLAFGSEEFEYDRYGETVTEIKDLSLVERYTGQVFIWNTEWQGD